MVIGACSPAGPRGPGPLACPVGDPDASQRRAGACGLADTAHTVKLRTVKLTTVKLRTVKLRTVKLRTAWLTAVTPP